jgi:hypothetical protein
MSLAIAKANAVKHQPIHWRLSKLPRRFQCVAQITGLSARQFPLAQIKVVE